MESTTAESDKTDQQDNNKPNTIEENVENDLSRNKMSSNTTDDENNESAADDITTGMETLTTDNIILNDSRDNDEGFEDVENDDDLDSNSDSDDGDDDDDDGWITPDNIKQVKSQMGKQTLAAVPANVTVGCLTTDFAMQVVISG